MDQIAEIDQRLEEMNREIEELIKNRDEETSWEGCYSEMLIEQLTEAGELDDGEVCEHKRKGVKINGYSYGSDIDTIDIFTVFCSKKVPSITISKNQIQGELDKAENFLQKCLTEGYFNLIPEASPVLDLALILHERRETLEQARIIFFTDCRAGSVSFPEKTIGNTRITFQVWDIQRMHQMLNSGNKREPIEIDFKKDFDQSIPCLEISNGNKDYKTVLGVFPGDVLADLYEKYGARLLERNVRAFLQARGKVNKGIRATLNTEPDMFLAFNNGITGTAENIRLEENDNGLLGITYLKDFQIVNGAQTTASLYHTRKKDKVDLSSAFVQAKICIVDDAKQIDAIVPLISRYSNSQNKVNEADFYANDPFHIEIETLSRTIWAPAQASFNQLTHWFYERSRGQYNDEKAKLTPAQLKKFNLENPVNQKFTKTDLAKFENTWSQFPWIVSLGSQKNFRDFSARLSERKGFKADSDYFQKLVARAILFKSAEKIVSRLAYGGYRANIVTYSLAWLSFLSYQRIDLDKIWRKQSLSKSLSVTVEKLSQTVQQHITNPPGGRNITEWCKKEECWKKLIEIDPPIKISDIAEDQTASFGSGYRPPEKGIDGPDENDQQIIADVMTVDSDKWFAIAQWAKQTDNLYAWQRSIAFGIGQLRAKGRKPSRKQAIQGKRILEEARRLGFPA
ncbi:MAG: AIPR family protein [Desulfosalsimonadaceae bacterium]